MNLQIALLSIGVILIALVYLISKRYQRNHGGAIHSPTAKKSHAGQLYRDFENEESEDDQEDSFLSDDSKNNDMDLYADGHHDELVENRQFDPGRAVNPENETITVADDHPLTDEYKESDAVLDFANVDVIVSNQDQDVEESEEIEILTTRVYPDQLEIKKTQSRLDSNWNLGIEDETMADDGVGSDGQDGDYVMDWERIKESTSAVTFEDAGKDGDDTVIVTNGDINNQEFKTGDRDTNDVPMISMIATRDERLEPVFDLLADDIEYGDSAVEDVKAGEQQALGTKSEFEQEPDIGKYSEDRSDRVKGVSFFYPEIEGFGKVGQIDYWVKILGDRDVGRESVLAQYRESASRIGKPSRIYGLRFPEKNWCNLEYESEEARFLDIVLTVQLADGNGPISEHEMTMFTSLVSNLSEGTGRSFKFMAPVESAMLQAQSIAQFIRCYNAIFMVNIRPQEAAYLEGAAIMRSAAQLGLEQDATNFFVRNKSVGKNKVCLYSMANMTNTGGFDFTNMRNTRSKGVVFFTKPAINRSPGAVFAEMIDTAKAFAARIKGEITSPDHNDLSTEVIEDIRETIEKTASEMEALGIASGSEEAMRIFKVV